MNLRPSQEDDGRGAVGGDAKELNVYLGLTSLIARLQDGAAFLWCLHIRVSVLAWARRGQPLQGLHESRLEDNQRDVQTEEGQRRPGLQGSAGECELLAG